MKIDFARLNHVLIPESRQGRDRLRRGAFGKALRPAWALLGALTPEGQAFCLAAIVVAAFGLDARGTEVYLLFCVVAGAVGASLVVSRALGLTGVTLEVIGPRRVTVGEVATFVLACRNQGPRAHRALEVSGPFLPWHARWQRSARRDRVVPCVEPGETGRAELRARFVKRGEHHLDPFRIAARVPLGLALGPSLETTGAAILVVPKPATIASLALPLGRRHQPGGVALASRSGESMDLLGVRPYRAGDPVRDLHARSSARAGVPVVREYQQEYFTRVGVVLDTSTDDEERLEAGIRVAAGVVQHLTRGEALIDLLVVGQTVHDLTLGRSLGTFEQALDLLACVGRGPPLDGEALVRRLGPRLARLSAVVVVTLADDAARQRLLERVEGTGARSARVLVDDDRVRAVARGEALRL